MWYNSILEKWLLKAVCVIRVNLVMSSLKRTRIRFFIVSSALIAACLSAGGIFIVAQCTYLKTVPTIPLLPNAVQTNKSVRGIEAGYPFVTEAYVSSASREQIISFYREHGSCPSIVSGATCGGKASPFGEYSIYISPTSTELTNFSVEITWQGCAWFK